jgi:hypothetical protein
MTHDLVLPLPPGAQVGLCDSDENYQENYRAKMGREVLEMDHSCHSRSHAHSYWIVMESTEVLYHIMNTCT